MIEVTNYSIICFINFCCILFLGIYFCFRNKHWDRNATYNCLFLIISTINMILLSFNTILIYVVVVLWIFFVLYVF